MKKRKKGFFDEDARLSELSQKGDFLEVLNQNIDWEMFRRTGDARTETEGTRRTTAERCGSHGQDSHSQGALSAI
tara:strand:+ start:111 stop:335 length:225 start_codon:yes stop_codon:yes gene_type:complete